MDAVRTEPRAVNLDRGRRHNLPPVQEGRVAGATEVPLCGRMIVRVGNELRVGGSVKGSVVRAARPAHDRHSREQQPPLTRRE